jgi:hypothetical protein
MVTSGTEMPGWCGINVMWWEIKEECEGRKDRSGFHQHMTGNEGSFVAANTTGGRKSVKSSTGEPKK